MRLCRKSSPCIPEHVLSSTLFSQGQTVRGTCRTYPGTRPMGGCALHWAGVPFPSSTTCPMEALKLKPSPPENTVPVSSYWGSCVVNTNFFFKTNVFRAVLGSHQHWRDGIYSPIYSPRVYMHNLPHPINTLTRWYVCHNWLTDIDRSWAPQVHSLHYDHACVVCSGVLNNCNMTCLHL